VRHVAAVVLVQAVRRSDTPAGGGGDDVGRLLRLGSTLETSSVMA
jgi:hypothetical protein